MIHVVYASLVMKLDVKPNSMLVVQDYKVFELLQSRICGLHIDGCQGLYLEARPDGQNENSIALKAYCSHHSLHHLEHYPIFPRDLEHALGNETAHLAKSMGVAEEDYNIIYRCVSSSSPPWHSF